MEQQKIVELKNFYAQSEKEKYSKLIDLEGGGLEILHFVTSQRKDSNDAEASIVHFISTPRIDPAMDVMNPFGMDDRQLMKNKSVFYNHRWMGPQDLPIGKSLWRSKQRDGVLAKTVYAVNEYTFAKDIYNLVKGDYLNSYSIGYIPTNYSIVSISQLPDLVKGAFDIPNLSEFSADDKVVLHNAWGCYEYSQVGVPMNEDAVKKIAKAMNDGVIVSDLGKTFFGAIVGQQKINIDGIMTNNDNEKGTIAFHAYPLADKGEKWDAGAEIKDARPEDLKKMCAWFDSSAPDVKGSYKLPHHKLDGYKTVWRGVANAAARLPQTDLPSADKEKIKSHLGKHYKEFGETAPWDKSAQQWERYEKILSKYKILPEFSLVADEDERLILFGTDGEAESKELGTIYLELFTESKSGAVLNSENKGHLKEALGRIKKVLASAGEDVPTETHDAIHCAGCKGGDCKGQHCKSCTVKGKCDGMHCDSCKDAEGHKAAHCKGCSEKFLYVKDEDDAVVQLMINQLSAKVDSLVELCTTNFTLINEELEEIEDAVGVEEDEPKILTPEPSRVEIAVNLDSFMKSQVDGAISSITGKNI